MIAISTAGIPYEWSVVETWKMGRGEKGKKHVSTIYTINNRSISDELGYRRRDRCVADAGYVTVYIHLRGAREFHVSRSL